MGQVEYFRRSNLHIFIDGKNRELANIELLEINKKTFIHKPIEIRSMKGGHLGLSPHIHLICTT
jgi:hypothetical protein